MAQFRAPHGPTRRHLSKPSQRPRSRDLIGGRRQCINAKRGTLTNTGDNKEVVRKAFEIAAAGDFEAMGTVIAEDYVRHSQATPDLEIDSLEAFKEFMRVDREAMPDQEYVLEHLVAEGDLVAFWGVYSGTQTGQMGPFPPTGKRIRLDISGIHRLADGKIVESWVTWDNIAGLTQLGLFPPPPQQQTEAPEGVS